MRTDLIIGLLVSLLIHGGLLYGDKLFQEHKATVKKAKADEEVVIKMDLPPPEPDKEEEVHEMNDDPVTNQLAPPSLVDMPSVVPVNAFTQPIQPPPPPGLTQAKGAISIPVTKPGAQLGKGMKDLFNVADLDQPPVPRVQPAPQYPFEMRRAGISGEVVLEMIVDSKGDVVAVQVIRSTQREFETPAIVGVQKWKFRPGRKAGRNVNTRCQISIPFTLSDE